MNKNSKVTAKKSKSGKTLEVRIPTAQRTVKSKKSKSKNKKNRARRNMNLVDSFLVAARYPDLVGPCRIPRFGGADRTGLAMDRARIVLTGNATNVVQGVQLGTGYYNAVCAQTFSTTGNGIGIGAGNGVAPGSAFPASSSIADINQTAGCLVISYTGSPLNATGEVIIGCCIPLLTTATYNSLYFYPGTLKFSTADLVNNPQRVCMRRLSPSALEFIPLSTNQADLDLPFIFSSGLNTGGTINIEVARAFEYRSTTADGSVIPYEKSGESFTFDSNAFQDANAQLAEIPFAVSPALPGSEEQGYIPYYAQMASTVGAGSIGAALTGLLMRNMQAGRHRGHPFGRMDQDLNFV